MPKPRKKTADPHPPAKEKAPSQTEPPFTQSDFEDALLRVSRPVAAPEKEKKGT